MGTAVVAAVCHPEIQADLLKVIRDLDHNIEKRMEKARDAGPLAVFAPVGVPLYSRYGFEIVR